MRLSLLARLSTCSLLLCLCPVLLGHCGGAANDREPGTETGNPPVVDRQKLRLVTNAAGAELNGEPGAVPGGAEVQLNNRSTGAASVVTASPDGTFRVEVTGSALDTYEVTVTHQGGTVTVPVAVDLNPINTDPSTLSCEQLDNVLDEAVRKSLEGFAAGCTNDGDCVSQAWREIGCQVDCGETFVPVSQREAAVAAAEQASSALCTEQMNRCANDLPGCPPSNQLPECYQGSCRVVNLAGVSCSAISERAANVVANILATTDRSCVVDTDCSLVPNVDCLPRCSPTDPEAVSGSAAAELAERLAAVSETFCSAFDDLPCSQLGCTAPPNPVAACRNDRCVVEYPTELP